MAVLTPAVKTGLFAFFLLLPTFSWAQNLAPEFELKDLDSDRTHRLSDYRGKVVYLDFWASWCGPCQQSLPALDALQKDFSADDFQVIAINVDEKSDTAKEFLSRFPVDYTILKERTGKTQRDYHLVGLPSSFLIDQHGEIIGEFQGFRPDHIEKVSKAIHYLLED